MLTTCILLQQRKTIHSKCILEYKYFVLPDLDQIYLDEAFVNENETYRKKCGKFNWLLSEFNHHWLLWFHEDGLHQIYLNEVFVNKMKPTERNVVSTGLRWWKWNMVKHIHTRISLANSSAKPSIPKITKFNWLLSEFNRHWLLWFHEDGLKRI
jgi:hypothetical protein